MNAVLDAYRQHGATTLRPRRPIRGMDVGRYRPGGGLGLRAGVRCGVRLDTDPYPDPGGHSTSQVTTPTAVDRAAPKDPYRGLPLGVNHV